MAPQGVSANQNTIVTIKILFLQLHNSTLFFIEIREKIQFPNNYINFHGFCEVLMAPQGVSANQNTITIIMYKNTIFEN